MKKKEILTDKKNQNVFIKRRDSPRQERFLKILTKKEI